MADEIKVSIKTRGAYGAEKQVGSFSIPQDASEVTFFVDGNNPFCIAQGNPPLPYGLTRRERETAALILKGMNRRQIAQSLIISENTAKEYISAVLKKSGCKNTLEFIFKYSGQKGI